MSVGFKKDWSKRLSGKTVGLICDEHGYKRGSGCDECGKKESEGATIHTFKPMWYHDIDVEPIYVESKRQLREECKKRGVRACRLM